MNNYVWKHFPGSEDWGLFPKGTKELEEDTAVVILSRMNSGFPWSVYINGKKNDRAIDGCETDKLNDIKEYILKNIDNILDKKEESLDEDVKKELPSEVTIDLATYYMDDWDSSHELGDWIADYLKDEFGKEPFSFDYDVEEDEYESTAFVKDIVWDKPQVKEEIKEPKKDKLGDEAIADYLDQQERKHKVPEVKDEPKLTTDRLNGGQWFENLNEADDDDIMSDDDLDAAEQRERDEMEARFKARRDKVAKDRADRDARIARQNELKAQAEVKAKEIGNDWSFDHLFDVLVPDSGKCDTLAGELIRAVNKIDYRWYNDGDRFFEDYGIETCGQPAYFLMNFEIDDESPLWDFIMGCAEDSKDDNDYSAFIDELKDKVCDIINTHQELLATETNDMYDIAEKGEIESFFDEHGMVPKYDVDCSIPNELQEHLDKGNISERDLIWEVESWIDNIGDARYDDVSVEYGNVYVSECNKVVYNELDGGSTLYRWLEDYATELTNEYGDPTEDEEDWAEKIADELGQDVDDVQNVLDTHNFDSYEDALEYVKNLIEEEAEENEEQ